MDDRPQLHAPIFGRDEYRQWARLSRVLRLTAARHCAGWAVHLDTIQPRPLRSALNNASHVANAQKMEHWYALVSAAPDGARLLLIDTDTMILRPLDDLWDRPFDFAYTTKVSRFPFNSGVVAFRASDRVRRFVAAWRDENLRMLEDRVHHQVWRKKYGGINQAALGHMLEQGLHRELQVAELPCLEWNCEDAHWDLFDPAVTRIVHLKSGLRQVIFFQHPGKPSTHRLAKLWKGLEQQALAAEGAAAGAAAGRAVRPGVPVGACAPGVSASRIAPARRLAPRGNPVPVRAQGPGRPRLHEPGAVTVHAILPPRVYDAYSRQALAAGTSVREVLRQTLVDRASARGFQPKTRQAPMVAAD